MIELLIVISVTSLIISMGFNGYKTWHKKILLIDTHDTIKSALVRTQQLATAAAGSNSWGMHFTTSSYTIFSGDTYDQSDVNNKTWILNGIEIQNSETIFSDAFGVYGPDVIFSKFDGEANNTGTISIILSIDNSYNKNIEVKSSGQVN